MKGHLKLVLWSVGGLATIWASTGFFGCVAVNLKQPHDLIGMIGMNQYAEVVRFVEVKGITSCSTDAFFAACRRDDDATIAWYLLKKGVDPKTKDACGRTALHAAAKGGSTRLIDELVRRGLDVNAVTALGKTPLDTLFEDEVHIDYDIVYTLLANGARLMNPEFEGTSKQRTALMTKQETLKRIYAMAGYSASSIDSRLVDLGLDPKSLDAQSRSKLMLDALISFETTPRMLHTLLQRGADPNQTVTYNEQTMPILHAACLASKSAAVRLLLKYGANPKAKDDNGRTAFEAAKASGAAQ